MNCLFGTIIELVFTQVIVATCQIIVDVIRHGFISVRDLNVIVFDECHHATGDHPMHQLMALFQGKGSYTYLQILTMKLLNETYFVLGIPKHQQPRVIGLTGMLLSGKVTRVNIIEKMEKLENTFNAVIQTVNSTDEFINVLTFSTNPDEKVSFYQNNTNSAVIDQVKNMVEKYILDIKDWPHNGTQTHKTIHITDDVARFTTEKTSKSLINSLKDFVYQMEDMGVFGASIAILSVLIDYELAKRTASTKSHQNLLRYLISGTQLISKVLEKCMEGFDICDRITRFSSQKLRHVIMCIEDHMKTCRSDELKGLIFVHRRYTAKTLYHILRLYSEVKSDFDIKSDFMVGVNNRIADSIENILENKWNRKSLERFKKGEINLIVASSVLEEGVDLQMCNFVLSYDTPITFRSYIQSKGIVFDSFKIRKD